MNPRVLVIVPTFNHGRLLGYAVDSARRQSQQNMEIVIIGDGASAETQAEAERLAREDSRIRFERFPKDSRLGERYRHAILLESRAEIVCYLADDDLWLPTHVDTQLAQLTGQDHADLAMTLIVRWKPAGGGLALGPAGFVDLGDPLHRRLFAQPTSGFASGLCAVAHTLDFYRTLPHGWRTTPVGLPTDGWMWKQCLAQPGVRASSRCKATSVRFHSPPRRGWTLQRRVAEMAAASDGIAAGRYDAEIARLEQEAARQSRLRPLWQGAWMQLHRSLVTGKPAMWLASAVLNRPTL